MQLDYNLLLDNIKRRRFDEAIRDHILSPSFLDDSLPEAVRYCMESMCEVDQGYTYKVYANTRRIENEIGKSLNAQGVRFEVRYQGPLRTETHVRLYGEVDMLVILDEKASSKDVFGLGQHIREVLSGQGHQSVDYGDGLRIQVVTQKPACKINLIPASWINNPQYLDKKNEIYRGIAFYNFKAKTKKKTLPFLNMARINMKDQDTNGGYKKVIRLLKTLCIDQSVSLNTYELAGLIYKIDDEKLICPEKNDLLCLMAVNNYIGQLLGDQKAFEVLLSPSEKELVFGASAEKRDAVSKLHSSLDKLVGDLKGHLGADLSEPVEYVMEPIHPDSE